MKYVVVSPVRNEEKFLAGTIRSMASQRVLPVEWIIVDDGSTDQTFAIAENASREYPWIKVRRRADRGFRQAGGGVIEAFYDGFDSATVKDWSFVVKFDGDLSFEPDYFEKCLGEFKSDPKLGIGGGTVCNDRGGVIDVESKVDPLFHVRGATKIYRRECWDQINGLIRAPGWDTLDEVKANMLGWTTRTFKGIRILHHRPTGAAYGHFKDFMKNGLANYNVGYHPVFMFLKCCQRAFNRPYLLQASGLWLGYIRGYLKRMPRIAEPAVIEYFQKQQLNRLMGRKSLWS